MRQVPFDNWNLNFRTNILNRTNIASNVLIISNSNGGVGRNSAETWFILGHSARPQQQPFIIT